jgi:hypothetical protein
MTSGRSRLHTDGLVLSICAVAVVSFVIGLWIGLVS